MKPSSTAGDASASTEAAAAAAASSSSSGPSTSASTSTADATHYIAKRVLRGSAVLHVAEGCFRSPDSADVVLAKVWSALLPHTSTEMSVESCIGRENLETSSVCLRFRCAVPCVSGTSVFDVAADCRVGWYQEGELFRVPDHQNDRECAGRRSFSDAVPEGLFIFFKDLHD